MIEQARLREIAGSRFVLMPSFLDAQSCAEALNDAMSGTPECSTISEGATGKTIVDERKRRSLLVVVSQHAPARVNERLLQIVPRLAQHFGVTPTMLQRLQYLKYRRGDFFRPHQDTAYHTYHSDEIRDRKISVVLFLNGATRLPKMGSFCGGDLVLYLPERRPDPRLRIAIEPGLLVAFRSDVMHEVRPVTHGERYSIVTWFAGTLNGEP